MLESWLDTSAARPKSKGLEMWAGETVVADERLLRRRSIAEAMKDDYVPRRQRKRGSTLQGPLTKKQLQKNTHIGLKLTRTRPGATAKLQEEKSCTALEAALLMGMSKPSCQN